MPYVTSRQWRAMAACQGGDFETAYPPKKYQLLVNNNYLKIKT